MPYVDEGDRRFLEPDGPRATTVGGLTYQVTVLVDRYLHISPEAEDAPRFADYAEAIAALECAKLELYRRLVAPYEDTKVEANGDVYTPHLPNGSNHVRIEGITTPAERDGLIGF